MRIGDWSSDVCSSDLHVPGAGVTPAHGGSREAEGPAGMSALTRRILPICLISGRCAPDCGMAQHGDGAVAWMVGASRPSPGQKDGTGALFAKQIGRAHV